jgi:hypothetical protein
MVRKNISGQNHALYTNKYNTTAVNPRRNRNINESLRVRQEDMNAGKTQKSRSAGCK